jgi:hypothetical protein
MDSGPSSHILHPAMTSSSCRRPQCLPLQFLSSFVSHSLLFRLTSFYPEAFKDCRTSRQPLRGHFVTAYGTQLRTDKTSWETLVDAGRSVSSSTPVPSLAHSISCIRAGGPIKVDLSQMSRLPKYLRVIRVLVLKRPKPVLNNPHRQYAFSRSRCRIG